MSIDLQGCGNLGLCFFESGRSEAQENSEAEEAILQLEPRKTEQVGRLPQADLIRQIGLQGLDVGIARTPSLLLSDRTLSERLKEPEIHRIQKDGLLLPWTLGLRGRSLPPSRASCGCLVHLQRTAERAFRGGKDAHHLRPLIGWNLGRAYRPRGS